MPTQTRATIVDAVSGTTGLARQDVDAITKRAVELIGDTLKGGQTVKLTGFGTLEVRSRSERIGRNPKTGEEHTITARRTIVFRPSAKVKSGLQE